MPESAHTQREVNSLVLLVEDVAAMRLYLRLTLEKSGFEVIEAANLREAINYLNAGHCPTSVLLDLELPDGSGLDIMRHLPSGIPVVALSADDSREAQLQCHSAGCAAVLHKTKKLGTLGILMAEIEERILTTPVPAVLEPEMAGQYRSYLAEARVELQRASDQHDFERARQIAHRLRGTAVHFGYMGVGASARNMGQAITTGSVDRIEASLEELIERVFDATNDVKIA